jgi:hypothetical protein
MQPVRIRMSAERTIKLAAAMLFNYLPLSLVFRIL